MKPGTPSGSAEGVAVFRALEAGRPAGSRLFDDPHADALLTTGARAGLALLRVPLLGPTLLAAADRVTYGQRAFVLARTALIDDALAAALGRDVEQVLILGAGHDSRAYRIPGIERARVFEVDHPATQARKRALLKRALGRPPEHVAFVPVDFNRQRLREEIAAAGFREGAASFVVWEGVTEYLEPDAVDATLRFLARAVAPGSELAFTYLDRAVLDAPRRFRGGSLHVAMVRWMGEPFTFGLDPRTLGAYLAARGFELLEDAGAEEFSQRYFRPRGRRERANDYQRIARARAACVPGPG